MVRPRQAARGVEVTKPLSARFVFDYASRIDFGWEVSYIVRGHFKCGQLFAHSSADLPLMKKGVEVVVLLGLCMVSLVLGLASGIGASQIGTALFFYLLAVFFFLAIFRPHSL
jgi:hypothetical protein